MTEKAKACVPPAVCSRERVWSFVAWDERERECVTNAVPPHLRRDVSSVIQAVWPPRVAVLFQFGRALLRNQRASPGSRSSGNPTDVRPRVAGLVVSQALWICSLQVGRPRSTADLQLDEHFPPPVQLNSILRIVGMVLCQPNWQSRSPLSKFVPSRGFEPAHLRSNAPQGRCLTN